MGPSNFKYKKFRAVLTCFACPEQYDIFKGSENVGYFRVRHGRFAAYRSINHDGPFYETRTQGDGMFSDSEREKQLHHALDLLEGILAKEKRK